jgi:hypothetical protein
MCREFDRKAARSAATESLPIMKSILSVVPAPEESVAREKAWGGHYR